MPRSITADVISCPGRLHDATYRALEITIEGVEMPYHCVLALPAVACHGLEGQVDIGELYQSLADAINAKRS